MFPGSIVNISFLLPDVDILHLRQMDTLSVKSVKIKIVLIALDLDIDRNWSKKELHYPQNAWVLKYK